MRVLAAMSGGVDSAVAAARAVDAGHDVVGVHLALSTAPGALRTGSRGCCSKEDADDARRAADLLGIPFYVWDFADRFKEDVIDEFVAAYAAGETPNPCLSCNEKIKFSALAERAVALGRPVGYAAPVLLGVGSLLTLAPAVSGVGATLVLLGAAGLCLLYVPLWRRQRDDAVLVSALGAVLALGGAVLWRGGAAMPVVLPWLAGFVVLTIALTAPLAWVSWRLVEKPAMRLGTRPRPVGDLHPAEATAGTPESPRRPVLLGSR